MNIDAVVLAGGRTEPALAQIAGASSRALIPFKGQPFIAWALEVLRGCAPVGRIVVVGPEDLRESPAARLADTLVPEREGIFENFCAGVDALGGASRVLVIASDNPLLTAAALEDFLSRCPEAEICYPILRGESFRQAFPGSDNTLVPLREGRFIGGACALFDTRALPALREAVARVFAARKSYWGMVGLLGLGFAARFLVRRATVTDVEQRISSLTGCAFRVVPDCAPVLAVDIDAAGDLEFILRHSEDGEHSR